MNFLNQMFRLITTIFIVKLEAKILSTVEKVLSLVPGRLCRTWREELRFFSIVLALFLA